MSDKWEVVTSKKSKAAAAAAVIETNGSTNGAKKTNKNTLKMEDILPRDQLQSLYSLNDSGKRSPVHAASSTTAKKPAPSTKPKLPDALLPPQKQKSASASSAQHRPKPKNLEAGLAALDVAEVATVLESYRSSFPDSHLVWLNAIINHLNKRLTCEIDATFVGHSPNYPANIVPAALKTLIADTLAAAGDANVHFFFDQTLASMADELTKSQPVAGHRIVLQLLCQQWPDVSARSLAKSAILRNSYQNRPPVGLSLLWAIGQGGYRDVTTAVRAWQNIMVPVLEIKAYTRFVCEYVHRVAQRVAKDDALEMPADEQFRTYDELTAQRQGLPRELQALLTESAALLLSKYIQSNGKITPVFVTLFKRLSGAGPKATAPITDALVECLERDADCLKAWRIHFRKFAAESNVLLRTLDKRNTNVTLTKPFNDFLAEVNGILSAIPAAKVDDDIRETNRLVKSSQDKSAQNKTGAAGCKSCRRCCGWTIGIALLLAAIVTALAYDTHIHGNVFAKSATGKFLAQTGALPYVETAWVKTMGPAARGYQWAERHVPVYATQAYVALLPYAVFVRDLAIVAWAAVLRGVSVACDCYHQKAPLAVAFIEQYAPGVPQKVGDASVQLWSNVRSTSSSVYANGLEFFKTKVFVGQLSPESLNLALNRTLVATAELNKWFHARVELFAKY